MRKDYPFIRAWGNFLRSGSYYIDAQVQQAIADKAPERAIYKANDGSWHTIDDVRDLARKQRLEEWVSDFNKGRNLP